MVSLAFSVLLCNLLNEMKNLVSKIALRTDAKWNEKMLPTLSVLNLTETNLISMKLQEIIRKRKETLLQSAKFLHWKNPGKYRHVGTWKCLLKISNIFVNVIFCLYILPLAICLVEFAKFPQWKNHKLWNVLNNNYKYINSNKKLK